METIYIIGAVLTFFYELRRGFLAALFFAAIWPVAWVLGAIFMIWVAILERNP